MRYPHWLVRLWHDDDYILSVNVLFFTPLIVFVLIEWFFHPFGLLACGTWTSLVNIALIAWLLIFALFICKKVRSAVIITTSICLLFALVNYYLLRFRSTPLLPWDIYSWQTGLTVWHNYDYRLDWPHLLLLVLTSAWLIIGYRCRLYFPRLTKCHQITGLFVCLGVFIIGTHFLWRDDFLERLYFSNNLYNLADTVAHDGLLASQLIHAHKLFLNPPPHYSAAHVQALLGNYSTPEATPAVRPHLIAIMDEAFSDLSVYGNLQLNQEALPTLHALQASSSAQTGLLHVSVKGGTTADTEWEFLTNGTMAFLPPGSVPYLQYSHQDAPALPRYLRSLGYQTTAIHPYNSTGWKRDVIYPQLGFQKNIFADDFRDPIIVHGLISDQSSFDKIIEIYQARSPGQPQFIWNVTMQNHSGYGSCTVSLPRPIHTSIVNNEQLDCYLSLMAESDAQLSKLIDFFSHQDEPTVIIFFGDHQPGNDLIRPLQAALQTSTKTDVIPDINYITPYLIWSNFPRPTTPGQDTSANYLSLDFLQAANLPLTPYQQLIATARKSFPVLTSQTAIAADGTINTPTAIGDFLDDYRQVQYWWLTSKN